MKSEWSGSQGRCRMGCLGIAAVVPSALPESLPLILTTTQQGHSHHSILQMWKPRLRDEKCWLQVAEQGPESRAPNKH